MSLKRRFEPSRHELESFHVLGNFEVDLAIKMPFTGQLPGTIEWWTEAQSMSP